MTNFVNWLNGKKTYLAAIGLIVAGLTQLANGDTSGGLTTVLQGLAVFFGRQALAKAMK